MAWRYPGGHESLDGAPTGRTVRELSQDAVDELGELVRIQQELAKLELRREGRSVGLGTGAFVFALLLLHLALILGSVTLGLLLWETTVLSAWVSFLIVTGAYLLAVALLLLFGWFRFKRLKGLPRSKAAFRELLGAVLRRQAGEVAVSEGRQPERA